MTTHRLLVRTECLGTLYQYRSAVDELAAPTVKMYYNLIIIIIISRDTNALGVSGSNFKSTRTYTTYLPVAKCYRAARALFSWFC